MPTIPDSWLVSNGGLIGTPVIEGLFGAPGVMICNWFLIPIRVMAFAAGESVFGPSAKTNMKQIVISVITNKIIIAIVLAMFFKFTSLPVPSPVLTTLTNIGKCMSPMSLMLIGKTDFSKNKLKYAAVISAIRLIVIPCAALIVCQLMHFDFMTSAIISLLLGMPAGQHGGSICRKIQRRYSLFVNDGHDHNDPFHCTLVLILKLTELIIA